MTKPNNNMTNKAKEKMEVKQAVFKTSVLVSELQAMRLGDCPPRMELDRIDNNKGYSPENCRWATHADQQRNKTNTKNLTFNGKTQCAKQWAAELGIHYATLIYRLNRGGWTVEAALTTPSPRFGKVVA
jgi:hypothetical protein